LIQVTSTIPYSRGGELLPLHRVTKGDGVDGFTGATGAAPAASPLISSQSADPYGLFRVSSSPRHEITQGVLYIVAFRSKRVRGDQD
jgi:hypothetical protein